MKLRWAQPFLAALTLALVGLGAPANADFSLGYFGGFPNDITRLQRNGDAVYTNGNLRLTDMPNQRGSVWSVEQADVNRWSTQFTFQAQPGAGPGNGGFTFTLQNNAPTALGAAGSGLGYEGIPNSVAIQFNLANNSTGLFTNGVLTGGLARNLNSSGINLSDGGLYWVQISYKSLCEKGSSGSQAAKHQVDHGDLNHRLAALGPLFIVLTQPAIPS